MKNSQLDGKSVAIKIIEIIKEFPSWVFIWYFFFSILGEYVCKHLLKDEEGMFLPSPGFETFSLDHQLLK